MKYSHHFALAIVNSGSGKEWEGSSLVHKCIQSFLLSQPQNLQTANEAAAGFTASPPNYIKYVVVN